MHAKCSLAGFGCVAASYLSPLWLAMALFPIRTLNYSSFALRSAHAHDHQARDEYSLRVLYQYGTDVNSEPDEHAPSHQST